MNTYFVLYPLMCLAIGWFLLLHEWIQQKQLHTHNARYKYSKSTMWNIAFIPIRTKIYVFSILTVIVVIILLISPDPYVWHWYGLHH